MKFVKLHNSSEINQASAQALILNTLSSLLAGKCFYNTFCSNTYLDKVRIYEYLNITTKINNKR